MSADPDFLPRNARTGDVKHISLADDLADVLSRMVVGWEDRLGVDLSQHPDVQRVMARYRASKADLLVDLLQQHRRGAE